VPQTQLRTGTDNAPVAGAGDYERLEQPAVWRNGRAGAEAQVRALEESGVERFDIPAFLRKQAD
jgi:cell division protein FtsZ